TVKKYHSEKTVTADGWRHSSIQLLPVNPAFETIRLEPEDAGGVTVIAALANVLRNQNDPSLAVPKNP
ncbi:MAG: hypothetical protein WD468_01155, partial [Pirellulales bacterium]